MMKLRRRMPDDWQAGVLEDMEGPFVDFRRARVIYGSQLSRPEPTYPEGCAEPHFEGAKSGPAKP